MGTINKAIRYQGTIASWDDARGFGFIAMNGGGPRVFAHIKAFAAGARRPVEGDTVTFAMTNDPRGRPQASAIALLRSRATVARQQASQQYPTRAVLGALAFLVLLALLVLLGRLAGAVFGLYLVLSVLGYLLYRADKLAARRRAWRTSEALLLMLGLAGGWPGALIAQRLLRHKTSKRSFQLSFWTTVALNCCALGWLLSERGADALDQLIGHIR